MGQDFQCGFCKDGTLENLATCTRCNSLHHSACFEESRQCTTYACGSKSSTAVTAEAGISETTTDIPASVESGILANILANHEPRMARIAEVTALASQSGAQRNVRPWYMRVMTWKDLFYASIPAPLGGIVSGTVSAMMENTPQEGMESSVIGTLVGVVVGTVYYAFRRNMTDPRVSQYDV